MKAFTNKISLILLMTVMAAGCGGGGGDGDSVPITGITVSGSVTLPDSVTDKQWFVGIDDDLDGDNGQLASVTGVVTGSTFNYSIGNVPSGDYFIYGEVDMTDTLGPWNVGDYVGVGCGTIDSPCKVTIDSSKTVDFTLVVMPGTPTTALTHASLNGTWATVCGIIDPVSSNKIVFVFNDGVGSGTYTTYNDNLCSPLNIISVEPATFTYIFGSNVTVDGSVSGITTATQIDITETTQGSATLGEITYDIGAIKDSTTLYLGDVSGTNDGSTAALRPTQLDGLFPLTKL